MKILLIIATVIAVAAGAAQFVPVARTNPPVTAPIEPPDEVRVVLARSCGDCHSNATRWPWYAHVAPMSWLVTHHVTEGRSNLNFSYWNALSPKERATKAKAVVDQLAAGKMPLSSYLLIHHDARLTPAESRRLRDWFGSADALTARGATAGPSTHDAHAGERDDFLDDGDGGH